MNNIQDEILEDNHLNQGDGKLPSFLNVLTILTFIGSGIAAIMGIYNLLTVEKQKADMAEAQRIIEETRNQLGSGFMDSIMDSTMAMFEHVYLLQGTALVVAIACLIGAYMMRQLKKSGFYLYTIACIASVAVPLSIVGASGVMGVAILLGSIFTIAFVIMYGVNLKYMK